MFEEEYRLFAEVILPLAAPRNYTYGIPADMEAVATPGKRVEIQFGQKKIYAGLIKRVHTVKPEYPGIKPILSVLDEKPVVLPLQMQTWEWISSYYLCTEGEVLSAALPAGFRLESETTIVLHPAFQHDYSQLSDKEYMVAEALSLQHELKVSEVQRILGLRSVYPVLHALMKKEVVVLKEQLVEKYKPRQASFVRLHPRFESKEAMQEVFDLLRRAPRQEALLMSFLHFRQLGLLQSGWLRKRELLQKAGAGESQLLALVEKDIFQLEKKVVDRVLEEEEETSGFQLSMAQEAALAAVRAAFGKQETVLLHGITGSGKTNIYLKLMEETLEAGRQVLMMVPEISLTTQIINRLKRHFGNSIGIYHSKFNQQERVEIWNKLLSKEYKIVLGARSALFLPFQNLGLILVDEEHDTSYKQQEPAPRYHARDAAIYLATQHQARVVLGTATPSFESYQNAVQGKYGLVELKERFGNQDLPEIILADVKEERRKKTMHSHFSSVLLQAMEQTLAGQHQVILFQNRRGYAPFTECALCSFIPQCPNCDVNLTYHKFHHELRCHLCGYHQQPLRKCPACGSPQLEIQGFGTEKIEDEIQLLFRDHPVARMDTDSIRTKQGHNKLIHDFEAEKYHILVGTQMVAKGLDFSKVTLVGVMSADQLLNNGNFRANERGYQLLEQVRGRAGRKTVKGQVVIQTQNPKYPVLEYLLCDDYASFFESEMKHRHQFHYPPYTRLIQITLKNKDKKRLDQAGVFFAHELKALLGSRVMGPAEPAISKVRNFHLLQLLLKLEKAPHLLKESKQRIGDTLFKMSSQYDLRNTEVEIDVDPY